MKKHLVLPFLFAAFLLAACGGNSSDKPKSNELDETMEVKAGEEFKITLETNPNSGLHWEIAVELDTAVVDYVWKEFVSKTGAENSSGWDVWTFKAIAPGETIITLGYYRGMTDAASKMARYKIIVK